MHLRKYYEVENEYVVFTEEEDWKPNALGLPPLTKRTFLVTGSTDGIGRRTAFQLAFTGATVILHGRDPSKVHEVMVEIQKQCPKAKLQGYSGDFQTMKEAREFGQVISERHPVIHGVLHNAATIDGDFTGKRVTTFGDLNEHTMAVNAYAPFLLTNILLKNLRASGAGRVVFSGSPTMSESKYLDDLDFELTWSGNHAYRLSKLVNAMTAAELDARYGDAPRLTFHAINTGVINTKLYRQGAVFNNGPRKGRVDRDMLLGTIPSAAASNASFDALVNDRFQETSGFNLGSERPDVSDPLKRSKLWAHLEETTGTEWPELPALLNE